jgi:hypothetical protein
MTHTPEQLKKLAEFAVEYLGNKEVTVHLDKWDINAHSLFESNSLAPILMHFAQEKLEKEGFRKFNHFYDGATHKIEIWKVVGSWTKYTENKNKFIAFWEATRQAKGGK